MENIPPKNENPNYYALFVIFQTYKNVVLKSVHLLGWLLWLCFYPITMLFMNVYIVHDVSNKFVDELLSLLHKYLLLWDNSLFIDMCHAKALTCKVGD